MLTVIFGDKLSLMLSLTSFRVDWQFIPGYSLHNFAIPYFHPLLAPLYVIVVLKFFPFHQFPSMCLPMSNLNFKRIV